MQDIQHRPTEGQIFKVALASIVGSVIEQYDYLVTSIIAATVWGDVFFRHSNRWFYKQKKGKVTCCCV